MLAAVRRNRPFDHAIRVLAVSGVALPAFWAALLLQLLFSVRLGWLPTSGQLSVATAPPPLHHRHGAGSMPCWPASGAVFVEALQYAILPAFVLALPSLAAILRVNRAEMIEVLGSDYVTAARAHGVPPWRVIGWLALKNAMLPTLAMIGLRFGWTLGSTVLVETVFDWPGLGLYAVSSAIASDFKPVMGVTLIDRHHLHADQPADRPRLWLARSRGPSRHERHRPAARAERHSRCAACASWSGRSAAALPPCSAWRWWRCSWCSPRSAPGWCPIRRDATGAMHLAQRLLPPSAAHWFGTDEMGDDIFTRVIIGTRTSLWVGLTITGIAALIGVPLGIISGYRGGALRAVIMRVTDVFLAVPGLVLALAIVAALGPSTLHGVVALSLVWWPGYVRLIEAKALTLRSEPYVEAARTMGAGHAWILLRHILPNCVSPFVVKASMDMGLAVLAAASLGFIGLGAKPPGARMGRDDLRRAQLHAGPVVVQLLPWPVHLPHRARLQPVRRRPARHPRPAQRARMR